MFPPPRFSFVPWEPEQHLQPIIEQELRRGIPLRHVSRRYRLVEHRLRAWAQRRGLPSRPPGRMKGSSLLALGLMPAPRVQVILGALLSGEPLRDIAAAMGVCRQAVHQIQQRYLKAEEAGT